MTDQRQLLMDYEAIKPGSWSVSGIGGTNLSVHGRGNVPIITEIKGKESDYIIKNVLHSPGIGINLFSIGAATEAGISCIFIENKCNFNYNRQLILTGERAAKTMYYLNIRSQNVEDFARTNRIGGRVCGDVCGPMSFTSLGGARYMLLFKDEASGWIIVYFMKTKTEVLNHIKTLYAFNNARDELFDFLMENAIEQEEQAIIPQVVLLIFLIFYTYLLAFS